MTIDPQNIHVRELYGMLVGAVAPRPISFASTVSGNGIPNLAPFSFFNVFGANPPIAVFSPTRSGRTNETKNTLDNVYEVDEAVINVVTYPMVQQMNLASAEYAKDVNEFEKAGFTPEPSELVRPARVKESPVQMECKVNQVVETGTEGTAANLIIAEIKLMHVADSVLGDDGKIDPNKIQLVGRMGGSYYSRAFGEALFQVAKPSSTGIGVDQLPDHIRNSKVLTGNDLGILAGIEKLPTEEEVTAFVENGSEELKKYKNDETQLHSYAQQLIEQGKVAEAWKALLAK